MMIALETERSFPLARKTFYSKKVTKKKTKQKNKQNSRLKYFGYLHFFDRSL